MTKGPRAFKPSFLLALPSLLCLKQLPGAEPPKPREEEQPLKVSDPKAPVGMGHGGSPAPTPALQVLHGQGQPSTP